MHRYTWIIFDADNTLFDFDAAERAALERTLSAVDVACDAGVRAAYAEISGRLWRAFERGEVTSERLRVARFEELLATRRPELDPNRVSATYVAELSRESALLPSAEVVVRALGSTHRLLLATNGIAEIQRRRFAHSSIWDCFHDVVISDEIGVAKPSPHFFAEAFRRMGDPAKRDVLMVGDSLPSDIQGGAGWGIDTCWFTRHLDEGVFDPRPTYRIHDLRELLEIVGRGV
jgi:YjjG family noncanonical pyrimidine nucleotidase